MSYTTLFRSRRLNASNLFLSLILHLGNLFLIVQLHFSKLFLILKSGVNHTSRGSISTSTLPSIKLRKCSSKIITSILSFISGRLATKSKQLKQLIRNGRSASLQRTFKKSFTSFSHSTRNKTRDGLIRVRNIRALNGRFNPSITHAYSIVIGSKHIPLNATGGGFLTASKQFRDRKSGSAGMPRPISYAVFCLKKKNTLRQQASQSLYHDAHRMNARADDLHIG